MMFSHVFSRFGRKLRENFEFGGLSSGRGGALWRPQVPCSCMCDLVKKGTVLTKWLSRKALL